MNNLRKGAAALVAAAALSAGSITLASAASHDPKPGATQTPCSKQQVQLDRAQAKLDELTAKFAAQSAKVKKDRRAVASTKGSAKARATKALKADKVKKAHTAKAKKAQVQRVAHATAALTTCQAASTPASTPTPTTTATAAA